MASDNQGAALVICASSGIGAIYAGRLAERGHDVIVAARDRDRLNVRRPRRIGRGGASAVGPGSSTGPAGLCRIRGRADGMANPPRTVHYVGFRDDRYWSAFRVFGGPRMIHRRYDRYALAEIGPEDVVVFAQGDDTQPVVRGAADIDERMLQPSRPTMPHSA